MISYHQLKGKIYNHSLNSKSNKINLKLNCQIHTTLDNIYTIIRVNIYKVNT